MTAPSDTTKLPHTPRPLVGRVVLVNVAVVAAVLATALVLQTREGGAGLGLAAGLVAAGLAASVLVNVLVVGPAGRVLVELTHAMETMHKGDLGCHLEERRGGAGLRRLTASFNAMCMRLGRE
jgi:hypothetical protein